MNRSFGMSGAHFDFDYRVYFIDSRLAAPSTHFQCLSLRLLQSRTPKVFYRVLKKIALEWVFSPFRLNSNFISSIFLKLQRKSHLILHILNRAFHCFLNLNLKQLTFNGCPPTGQNHDQN